MNSRCAQPLLALVSIVSALTVGPAAIAQAEKGNLARATKQLLLVLPVDVTSASVPGAQEVSSLLTDVLASRAIVSNAYSVTQFYKAQPTIVRLHNDQQLTDADVTPPFAEDNRKALKIGKLVGYDKVLLGSVDDYEWDDAAKQARMTVSARMLEIATGKVLKNVVKSGVSGKGGTAKEEEKALEAAREVGGAIVSELIPVTAVSGAAPTPAPIAHTPRKKSSNAWLWGLLAVGLGLGIGLSGGGGGGGIEGPPSPPH